MRGENERKDAKSMSQNVCDGHLTEPSYKPAWRHDGEERCGGNRATIKEGNASRKWKQDIRQKVWDPAKVRKKKREI